jgi:hypothetical protein
VLLKNPISVEALYNLISARQGLGYSYAAQGHHRQASEQAEFLAGLDTGHYGTENLYEAALIYSEAITVLEKDVDTSPEERDEFAQRYLHRVFELIGKCHHADYFDVEDHLATFLKSKAFTLLNNHAQYQELLSQIGD